VKGTREVDVTIPAGVETGTVLQMRGEGGKGSRGIRPGNLHIQIQVMNHPVFRREGADVHVDATVSVVQAILGGQVQVPTLAGDVVLKLRAGTQPGQKQVLRGKGIKVLNSKHYGDQYVHINVAIPVNINQHQQSLIEEFGRYESAEAAAADQAAEGSG
jgi:molecular chaperone DnaJ